ncbi:alanine--tRNA ligase [Anaerotignum lactatifermentans]|jgi:alanyl-tRNA synthetase|uniref:alanine--tRNA ligase n=1 Tax=Anaerotignum lactatifermentans TaxID=160404 RepID=UPI00174C1163|nr:alanine--tRNA ligase [Anaerotignum lactatifermentans]HJE94125.1 alanine--tRNA ligase [Anaerotignum lactatifermentans]
MKYLGVNEIREEFLKFFESKDHLRLPSFPLVPRNDNSLLLINSGMAPMKAYFTGQEIPPSKRVTTCQKCIRTGDIDNVGKTARHGTFFEMLGDFSFGDYFKNEIVPWSWEFVTKVLEIPEDRLYVTIYEEDDETGKIWHDVVGLPWDRIVKLGKEDNFWEHGTGPCGPCTEIYYDRGPEYGCDSPTCGVGCDCDRYMEFWNLVLTQFNAEEDGTYTELAMKNVDTGMGLERMATIMQGVDSIFDVDTVKSIRDAVCAKANVEYGKDHKTDVSVRVITDHIRSVTMMTADGVLPSNEGRGYVLRRLLRRAARHGKLLGIEGEFLAELSKSVIACSGEAYPELVEKQDYIFKILSIEENSFYKTIDKGMEILKADMEEMKAAGEKVMSGEKSFRLYDTYGFPVDLTKEILAEEGMEIDEDAFTAEMKAQKERARSARAKSNYMGAAETVYNELPVELETAFAGYDVYDVANAKIVALVANEAVAETAQAGDTVAVFLDRTPFYAESGGQVGDQGVIKTETGVVKVTNCVKVVGGKIAHMGEVTEGLVQVGEMACASIDVELRMASSRNHSATHLLHKALRTVLGTHVEQAGSYVSAERLRFDFTHFAAMTADEIKEVERLVNDAIFASYDVHTDEMSIDEARNRGAMALFGEKYGEVVRVVDMGGYSIELCGGAHLKNTAQVGSFKILSENGVAAGVRRIEAVTGKEALKHYQAQEDEIKEICRLVKSTPDKLLARLEQLLAEQKETAKELEKLKAKMAGGAADEMLNSKVEIGGVAVLAAEVKDMDGNALRTMGDQLKQKLGSGVVVLASGKDGKVNLMAMATDDVVKKGVHAGNIIKAAAAVCGGGGGGRPNMAQAGGKDASKIADALEKAKAVVAEQLG